MRTSRKSIGFFKNKKGDVVCVAKNRPRVAQISFKNARSRGKASRACFYFLFLREEIAAMASTPAKMPSDEGSGMLGVSNQVTLVT